MALVGKRGSVAFALLAGVATAAACGTHGSSGDQATGGTDASTVGPGPDASRPGADATPEDAARDVATGATDGPSTIDAPPSTDGPPVTPSLCSGAKKSTAPAGPTPPAVPAGLTLAGGFTMETLAAVSSARQMVALPNGDLLVATSGTGIYLVPNATGTGLAGAPVLYATIDDSPAQGLAFSQANCTVYVGAHAGIYAAPYVDGQTSADFGKPIAAVRTGIVAPNSDGDVHTTTSVGFAGGMLYAGVGSSCNACTETDPTRAVILGMDPTGANGSTKATRIRNAIALTTNPATGTLWAGGAGQDDLAEGHPFEFFDAVTLHSGTADYGWPDCEENQAAYVGGSDCSKTVAPRVELPAYSTLIGAAFYPAQSTGAAHAFPASYAGGIFLAAHGGWHQVNGLFVTAPRVAFVAMKGDSPVTAVNWKDATAQWTEFMGGFQSKDNTARIGRPSGVAVGPDGSLFVGDDQNGLVYRVRPN